MTFIKNLKIVVIKRTWRQSNTPTCENIPKTPEQCPINC